MPTPAWGEWQKIENLKIKEQIFSIKAVFEQGTAFFIFIINWKMLV